MAALEEWEERFYAAFNSVEELSVSDGLCQFRELLEECHIAVFAPEIKTTIKSPLAKLADTWEKLRI